MPARLRDIKRALVAHGIMVREPSKGSHWVAFTDCASYRIPAHNALKEEISDTYIKGLCRAFKLDYTAFKREL